MRFAAPRLTSRHSVLPIAEQQREARGEERVVYVEATGQRQLDVERGGGVIGGAIVHAVSDERWGDDVELGEAA